MERLTDMPKVSRLRWGALSDSPQALTNLCALFTTLQSCLSNTDSSLKGKTHIQNPFPHRLTGSRGGEWDRRMMEAEQPGPLTPSTSTLSSLPGHEPPGTLPPCFQIANRGRQRLPGSSPERLMEVRRAFWRAVALGCSSHPGLSAELYTGGAKGLLEFHTT